MANGTLKVSNIQTSSGSGTITLGQSGETVDLSNATTTLNSSMKATPAFEAYLSASQSISDNTLTKVQFDTEVFDTNSTYDNSTNYRFTPGVAGKYFVYAMAQCYGTYDANDISQIKIYKNGSANVGTTEDSRHDGTRVVAMVIHSVVDLNATDYLEIYCKVDVSSATPEIASAADSSDGGNYGTRFGAYKIIGA